MLTKTVFLGLEKIVFVLLPWLSPGFVFFVVKKTSGLLEQATRLPACQRALSQQIGRHARP